MSQCGRASKAGCRIHSILGSNLEQYVILRNSERFWPFYDWLNNWNFHVRGDDAGWLDLTYYDAPER